MKQNLFLSLALMLSSFDVALFGQTDSQVRSRIEGTDRPVLPPQATGEGTAAQKGKDSPDVSTSDTGAQRPVQLKENGISSFFGYNTKYFYRSNPLAQSGTLKQQATGMWTNTFFAGSGLGVFETGDAVITPYIGASWTINDYIEGGLDAFNYNSAGAYALLLTQFGNGWSVRAGVSYSADSSTVNDTEDYKEYYPNIGVLKSTVLNDSTTGIFDASIGSHNAESDTLGLTTSDIKELSSIEYAASYALNYEIFKFVIIPKYRISYKTYSKGTNNGRDDLSHDAGIKIDYPIADSLKISAYYDYSNRNSNVSIPNYDYKSYDFGISIGLNARF
tara:strand:+ start:405 stop:1403 length:999 start_codon:yes stop_codon:yes gene_type:complete